MTNGCRRGDRLRQVIPFGSRERGMRKPLRTMTLLVILVWLSANPNEMTRRYALPVSSSSHATALSPSSTVAVPQANGPIVYSCFGRNDHDICRIDSDGTHHRNLTRDHDKNAWGPVKWSPDGSRIAFGCADQVCIMRRDGTHIHKVTSKGHNGSADWSPDGTRLVFVHYNRRNAGPDAGLRILRLRDKRIRRLTTDGGFDPAWSVANVIAYARDPAHSWRGLYAIRSDGTDFHRLTNRWDYSPDWSPDGARIVWIRRAPSYGPSHLRVGRADGSRDRAISPRNGDEARPSWSPDGRWISFDSGAIIQIFVCRPDGSRRRQVTTGSYDHAGPDWGIEPD
ncbi:MAG: TolB protein [Actinomycetota bacterium]|jgi:Tol biopolymer transport system component|nr:TolB protein [Actinomycetota bacterium]